MFYLLMVFFLCNSCCILQSNYYQRFNTHHQYFLDSVSYQIISAIKGDNWYLNSDFEIVLSYYIYEDCKYIQTNYEINGTISSLSIDRFIDSLNKNISYTNYLQNLIHLHCKGINESGITNGLHLQFGKLSLYQIKCLNEKTNSH